MTYLYTHFVFLLYHTVAGVDYRAAVGEQLVFAHGQNVACHNVSITQDDICEINPIEDFFSSLTNVDGIMLIIVEPPRTRVIIDDTNEPECRKYR